MPDPIDFGAWLTRKADTDPTWEPVLEVYLDGLVRFPHQFRPRPPASRPPPDPPAGHDDSPHP